MSEQEKIFKEFDADNSGFLELDEVKNALDKLSGNFNIQPTLEDVKNIVAEQDTDNNGKLDMAEFCKLFDSIQESGNQIREQFQFFDRDGNGKVSKKELKKALRELNENISKTDLKRMIKDADVDGDGEIDFEEFQKILASV